MIALKTQNRFPTEPWKTPLAKRIRQVEQARAAGLSVNLMLYEKADSSTFRYRVFNIAQALNASTSWRAVYFFEAELAHITDLVLTCQLITVVRFRWTFALENLLTQAKLSGLPIAFDTDDLVFDLDQVPALVNLQNIDQRTDFELNFWFSYVARIQKAAQLADAFITTNDYLGQILTAKLSKPAFIIRNFLNREQIEYSAQLRQEKAQLTPAKPFTIGYFSGSPSHFHDLHGIADELAELLDTYADIQLLIVGYMEFAPRLKPYLDQGRIRFHRFVDFLTLQRLIAEVDVNIAPLYPNDFTECKSELKFFEAALVNTVTIASPTFTFKSAITSGENGYLCRQGDWYKTIQQIYLQPEAQSPVLDRALESTISRYSPAQNLQAIEQTCQALLDMVK